MFLPQTAALPWKETVNACLPGPVAKFLMLLQREFADARVRVSQPRLPEGDWKLVVTEEGERCSIYWHVGRGFEIFAQRDARSSASAPDAPAARPDLMLRMRLLLARAANPRVHVPMSLVELRQVVGATVADMAAALDLNQGLVCQLEHRDDIEVRSLAQYIAALGGELELRAKFKDFEASIEPVVARR